MTVESAVWRKIWTMPDGTACYEAKTDQQHGLAIWSPQSKSWYTEIVSVCGFCVDFAERISTPCPHHPERYQEPKTETAAPEPEVAVPVSRSVPEQFMGKAAREEAAREQAEQAARKPIFV